MWITLFVWVNHFLVAMVTVLSEVRAGTAVLLQHQTQDTPQDNQKAALR